MNPLSFLPLLMLALLQGSTANAIPRSLRTVVPRAECEPSDFIGKYMLLLIRKYTQY